MSSDNIDSVRVFYGNGTVYVSDLSQVRAFNEYNFQVESLRTISWGDYWVTDEVIETGAQGRRPRPPSAGRMRIEASRGTSSC